jgi:NADPH-dependent curcumin reductase CurA
VQRDARERDRDPDPHATIFARWRAPPLARAPFGSTDYGEPQWTLAARPIGESTESDFALVEAAVLGPAEGGVLVRTRWLSLDPYMRCRMSEARSYATPVPLGGVMTGKVVGEVVESGSSRFTPGQLVTGRAG